MNGWVDDDLETIILDRRDIGRITIHPRTVILLHERDEARAEPIVNTRILNKIDESL